MWIFLAAAGAAGAATLLVGAIGCGFVPGLDSWFGTRSCFSLGFISGLLLD